MWQFGDATEVVPFIAISFQLQEEKVVISSKAPTGKRLPAEQKRQLEELESRLELLSSKLKEANKMVSMKAKSEEKAAKLAEEIASMKAAKVSLLKRLEDEAKRFRYQVA